MVLLQTCNYMKISSLKEYLLEKIVINGLEGRDLVYLAVGHDQVEEAGQAKKEATEELLGTEFMFQGLGGMVWKVGHSDEDVQQQPRYTLHQSTKNKNHIKLSGKSLQNYSELHER